MKKMLNLAAIFAATTALAACANYRQPYGEPHYSWSQKEPAEQASRMALDNRFNEFVRTGYLEFAKVYSGSGLLGADHYAKKALLAERGIHPEPEELFLRSIATRNLNELADARGKLEAAFARHARWFFPREAADAQLAFDCWVEESERLWGSKRMDQCRTTFWNALAAMQKPAPAPEPVVVTETVVIEQTPTIVDVIMPQPFIVFFDHDKDVLAPGAEAVLATVAREYQNFKPANIDLLGNADTSGTSPYNDDLSMRRVIRVKEHLEKLGIPADKLQIAAMGERKPRLVTADGVKEPANRYVTITFIK